MTGRSYVIFLRFDQMPILQRYSNIKNGGIVFIGNTLGLSKATDANRAGTLGSIGAFISPDSSLKVNDFPAGQSVTVEFAVTVI